MTLTWMSSHCNVIRICGLLICLLYPSVIKTLYAHLYELWAHAHVLTSYVVNNLYRWITFYGPGVKKIRYNQGLSPANHSRADSLFSMLQDLSTVNSELGPFEAC
jgi:hypothetical protein